MGGAERMQQAREENNPRHESARSPYEPVHEQEDRENE